MITASIRSTTPAFTPKTLSASITSGSYHLLDYSSNLKLSLTPTPKIINSRFRMHWVAWPSKRSLDLLHSKNKRRKLPFPSLHTYKTWIKKKIKRIWRSICMLQRYSTYLKVWKIWSKKVSPTAFLFMTSFFILSLLKFKC